MSWHDKRDLIVAENAAMGRELELLREMVRELRKEKSYLNLSLKNAQEALIAQTSPEAYRDQKNDEYVANAEPMTDKQEEARRNHARRSEIVSDYIQGLEGPLFKDADDMISMLSKGVPAPLEDTPSLHGNDES